MNGYQSKGVRLYEADALERLAKLEEGTIDVVVTDPPYAAMEKHRARGTTTRLSKSEGSKMPWFSAMTDAKLGEAISLMERALKPGAHAYIMANSEQMWITKLLGENVAGLKFHKAIIWNKLAIGMGYHYRSTYEAVLFFSKKGPYRKLHDLGTADCLTFDAEGTLDIASIKRLKAKPRKSAASRPDVMPTEKPVALMELLIRQSSRPGETVLDPFTGGGAATAVAAVKLNRKFLGYEIHPPYCKEAMRRIEAAEGEFGREEDDDAA